MSDITIYSLAEKLNMTPSMVSRALSPNGKISEEKRKLVLAAAKKYNFNPNKLASRLAMKPIRIGVVIVSKFEVNTKKMLLGIEAAHAQLKDYKIKYEVSVFSHETPAKELQDALDIYQSFDGVILAGMSAGKYTNLIRALLTENKNVVQVQAINPDADCLFCSKHDEAVASALAAEMLSSCLTKSERKNILLFTGDLSSTVHQNAKKSFLSQCEALGMNLVRSVDMRDDEAYLESILPEIFSECEGMIDGIYITSGLSLPLCRYLEQMGRELPFVAFDTYEQIKDYMRRGIVTAAISQNIPHQMQIAFERLVHRVITAEECRKTVYTDVQLVLRANMHQFD